MAAKVNPNPAPTAPRPGPSNVLSEMGLNPATLGTLIADAKQGAAKFEKDVADAMRTVLDNQKVMNAKLDRIEAALKNQ
jgi:hypothetical protein